MLTAGNTSVVYIAISLDATDVGSFTVAGAVPIADSSPPSAVESEEMPLNHLLHFICTRSV